MSAGPDRLVAEHGEKVTIERVIDYELDANGQVTNLQTEYENVLAVPSQPTEEDLQRTDGRLSTSSLRLTLTSDADVEADRGGERDRVYYPARDPNGDGTFGEDSFGGRNPDERAYQVVEVQDDEHPITNTRKRTALVSELGGAGITTEDAY